MLNEIPCIIMASNFDVDSRGQSIEIILTGEQKVEVLQIKLNEAIRHIQALEAKLLNDEEINNKWFE
ncbi:hypothetical protein LCGC14_2035190 [marine sediment metagenome]|uniref:Uncharacterized protein n=1 Tax=marine sediment metagenome TaxID=412755 RepID=A0A0F9ETR6_9ZZZZ